MRPGAAPTTAGLGPTTNPAHAGPLLAYGESHKQSISGGVFYDPPRPLFPAGYAGKYFFADFILNWIRVLDPDRPRDVAPFASGLAGPVALDLGPDGSLYVLCRNAWVKDDKFTAGTGTLHRIFPVSDEAAAPRIVSDTRDVTAAVGDHVRLSIEARGAAPLEYRWLRNGRPLAGAHGPQADFPVTAADDGVRLRCVISNQHGTIVSREARIWLTPLRSALKLDAEPQGGIDRERNNSFAGLIRVDRDGVYTFQLTGDGVANLFVAGDEVVRLTPSTAPARAEGAIGLKAGWHALRLIISRPSPESSIDLAWSGPGVALQPIPADRLARAPRETKPPRPLVTSLHLPEQAEHFPRLLSETGVFTSLQDLTPAEGIVPYEVNSPLWSDGAAKRRWIAVRGDRRIQFSANGPWQFPPGTVFIKHFELPSERQRDARRLETRLLVTTRGGEAFGVTYKWRTDGSDAELLEEGLTEDVPSVDGPTTQRWSYPGRKDCLVCHTQQASYVLGVNTRQLNRPLANPHDALAKNQVEAWSQIGMFEQSIPAAHLLELPALSALNDGEASLVHRVRSYLDSNCSQCHRPGSVRGEFDARFETPLDKQKLLNGKLVAADLGIPRAVVVAPANRGRSMLLQRIARRQDVFNMPPLATHLVDREALDLIGQWIDGL